MTSDILEEWVLNLNSQNRKIALFVDNCPAHPNVASKPSNVNLNLCPPEHNFKTAANGLHHGKCLLRRLIWALQNKQPTAKVTELRISIAELAKVWQNNVLESTIKNCFAKYVFIESFQIKE